MDFVEFTDYELEVIIPDDLLSTDEFKRRLPDTVADIVLEARNFWEAEAGRRLRSSLHRYQEAIKIVQDGDQMGITLDSDFARGVETGMNSFDMKPGFLASSRIKTKRYVPKFVADQFKSHGAPSKWMVIPLNVDRSPLGFSSGEFRTFTDTQPGGAWQHPGIGGVNIAETVITELNEVIIPKHLEKLIDSL